MLVYEKRREIERTGTLFHRQSQFTTWDSKKHFFKTSKRVYRRVFFASTILAKTHILNSIELAVIMLARARVVYIYVRACRARILYIPVYRYVRAACVRA